MFFKYLKVGLAATAALLLGGAACAAPAFHVGIVTGTLSQSEDEIRGAEYCLKKIWRRIQRRYDPACHLS